MDEYEVHQGGQMVASVTGPADTAMNEVFHYLAQYSMDGPVRLYLVTRTEIVIPGVTGDLE